jgi:uncharacterized protein YabE (DUF348 family)
MSTNLPPNTSRKLLSLALVAILGVPLLTATTRVRVAVDGDVLDVRSYAETVAGVLARQGIDVAPSDRIHPTPDTPVEEGMRIAITRAIRVRLVAQDGSSRLVLTPARSLNGVMQAAGMADAEPIRPFRGELSHGDRVRVRIPMPVTVTVDGGERVFDSTAATLGDALAEERITLGPRDRVAPPLDTSLTEPVTATITRISSREEVEEIALPFSEEIRETSALLRGQRRVVTEGSEGLRRDVHVVTVVDGRDVARRRVSSDVVREPVTRVVEVGTREPASAEDDATWYRLAHCESGGDWTYDGTYDGGLQFHPDTWRRWKPSGYPDHAWQATAAEQIAVGKRLHAARGWRPWPSCARRLGLR